MCLEETTNGQNAVFAYHVAQGSGRESETSTQSSLPECAMDRKTVVRVERLSSICYRETGL